jgi:hypothetical protein
MWTAAFWKAAAERALKTFAQFAAVLFVPYLAAGDGLDLTAVPGTRSAVRARPS